jgi:hypothetical protein
MVEHLLDVAGMIANRAPRIRVRQTEARPVQGYMPAATDLRQVVRKETPARRSVAVDDDRSRRIGVTPNRITHVPAVRDLQPVRSVRLIHVAESRSSPVRALEDRM